MESRSTTTRASHAAKNQPQQISVAELTASLNRERTDSDEGLRRQARYTNGSTENGLFKNKNVRRSVLGTVGIAIAAAAISSCSIFGGDNNKAPEQAPPAASDMYRASAENYLATYGLKEQPADWGASEAHLLHEGRFDDAINDIDKTAWYNSELESTLLTFSGYKAEGVPVPNIDDFKARDEAGNFIKDEFGDFVINDKQGLAEEMNKLGTWLFENTKAEDGKVQNQENFDKITEAHAWLVQQLKDNKGSFEVIEHDGPYWSAYLQANNAGEIDDYVDHGSSTFWKIKMNGQEFLVRSDCNWQVSGRLSAPVAVTPVIDYSAQFTPAVWTPVQEQSTYTLVSWTPPVEQPPVGQPPVEQPPVEQPPIEQPPVVQPPVVQPPVVQPPVQPPQLQSKTGPDINANTLLDTFNRLGDLAGNVQPGQYKPGTTPQSTYTAPTRPLADLGTVTPGATSNERSAGGAPSQTTVEHGVQPSNGSGNAGNVDLN